MSTRIRRYDVGRLGSAERTPQGGIRVQAMLTRSGVFEYIREDGSVQREHRSVEQVFDAASLQSLGDAPVTDLHPDEQVNAANYTSLAVGHVSGIPVQSGTHVAAVLVVQDANEIALIDAGERIEISCGYDCVLDMTPGKTPEGEPYDCSQTFISYNHAALLPAGWGRAGSSVGLRLDGKAAVGRLDAAGHALPPAAPKAPMAKPLPKKTTRKDGDVIPPAVADKPTEDAAICEHCGAPVDDAGKFAAPPKVDADVVPPVEEDETTGTVPEPKTDSRTQIRERVSLERVATKAGIPDAKLDALDDHALRLAVIAKAFPGRKLDAKDAKDPRYVAGLYDMARERVDTAKLARALGGGGEDEERGDSNHTDSDGELGLIDGFAISQTIHGQKKGGR